MDIYTTLEPFLRIIYTIIVIIASYATIKIISHIVDHLKRFEKNLTIIYAIKNCIKYGVIIIAVLIIFNIFGIDLKGMIISIGVMGIVVSLAAKNIISNFLSGFFLIADKSLKVGDTMQIYNLKGEVKEIGLRNTSILTETGNMVMIPNSALSTTPYSRFKKHEKEKVILDVSLPLDVDVLKFKKEFFNIINTYDEIAKTPQPKVETEGIDENIKIKIKFWVKRFNKKEDYKLIITNQIRKIINENRGDDN